MPSPFVIRKGETHSRNELREKLVSYRYERVPFVVKPGDFAERGALLDIYPVGYRHPMRLSFHGAEIEWLRDFSLTNFNMLSEFDEVRVASVSEAFFRAARRMAAHAHDREVLEAWGELQVGDYVVHLNYGIGKFLGSKRLRVQGEWRRHLAMEYADREILYLEETTLRGELERYVGFSGKPPRLTKLHSSEWERVKERTRVAVRSVARELLELAAKRDLLKGHAFKADTEWQKRFEKEFPYEETPDQVRTTREVKADMESPRPMDRLLCGDVGYGKTEVALRAAFKAVMDGRQVAFLVPTTILAEQHHVTLSERLKTFPVEVDALSRFKTPAEQAGILKRLKDGSCDVVIGTHRLLSDDVVFKDLGLVIIDEEQRFGVRHKERLKRLRELVDVLTLTATPIPRTLYFAITGARDLSLIQTPPKAREPVETQVGPFEESVVREAIERELARGGQIYFVHNRIDSIEKMHRQLLELAPGLKLGVAHGRLPPKALAAVMLRFIRGEIDCLLSTSIIESGLDIPNVNTLIVNRADRFGLADLYQLRGRVGRFTRRAYAYFFFPKVMPMTEESMKRLAAIERFTALGSGFDIALEDLEIRGAGNLLGEQQSGFIYQVGFDLYCKLLKQTVETLKKEIKSTTPGAGSRGTR